MSTSTAIEPAILAGGELYQACQSLFERYPHALKGEGFSRHRKGQPWRSNRQLTVSVGDLTITILDRDVLYEVRVYGCSEMAGWLYWGRTEMSERVDQKIELAEGEKGEWFDNIPASLTLLLEQSIAFPRISSLYGMVDDRGLVSVMFYTMPESETDSRCTPSFYVLQDEQSSDWTPSEYSLSQFWELYRAGHVVLLDEILSTDAEFWKYDIGEHSYFGWYPAEGAATAHPELPANAVYRFYETGTSTSTSLPRRPSLAAPGRLEGVDEAENLTPNLRFALAWQLTDHKLFKQTVAQINAELAASKA